MSLRPSFATPPLRHLLSGVAVFSLFACVRGAEVKTVRSNGSLSSTTELTQRVVTGLGYTAASDDVSTENAVIASAWQDYPPGHAAAGMYRRRAVVVLREKAATRKRPAVIDADARIDVAKCTWASGQANCHLVDRHYEEDERDLDTLAARLLMAYQHGNVPSTMVSRSSANPAASVQRPSEETTVQVTRPDAVPAPVTPPPASSAPAK